MKTKKYKKPKVLANGKSYKYEYPHLVLGHTDTPLILMESGNGYISYLGKGEWIGMPKSIVENNDMLYKEIFNE